MAANDSFFFGVDANSVRKLFRLRGEMHPINHPTWQGNRLNIWLKDVHK